MKGTLNWPPFVRLILTIGGSVFLWQTTDLKVQSFLVNFPGYLTLEEKLQRKLKHII